MPRGPACCHPASFSPPLASQLVPLTFNILLLSPGRVANRPPLTPAGPPGTLSAWSLACDTLWALLVLAAAHTLGLTPEQCLHRASRCLISICGMI